MDYYHNYDLVINWLSQAFKGQTLKVLGIDTAPIKRVCSFKLRMKTHKADIGSHMARWYWF